MKDAAHQPTNLWPRFAICAGVVALIWIVFGQTLRFDFVNYDDRTYVYENSLVSAGLSLNGLARAFVDTQTRNWHPLTIISHMIDCQFYGLKAGGHHFTNVLLHSLAAVLLFLWLCNLTGGPGRVETMWRSAFVTAVFAIHPLRVESVAWIAERKDVLSAVFFFLTLAGYTRYARAPSFRRYASVVVFLACGLLSKPMLVTTPAILLLLDYWPLGRLHDSKSFWRLAAEKMPLGALSLISSAVTFILQIQSHESMVQLPFGWRLQNALVTYLTYIRQIFWPANLAVFYPHPDNRLASWQVALAAIFLIAATWTAFALRKRCPYVLIGWLWYLIMLLPVIGVIEVGLQGHADRYTYLPHVGLYIALAWLVADLSSSVRAPKQILGTAGVAVVLMLAACSWKQTTYWRNSETLWTHTLTVTQNNDVAFTNLGGAFLERGQLDDALASLQRALDIRSSSKDQHYNLSLTIIHDTIGNVLTRTGRINEALGHFRQAIQYRPDYPDAHYNLGVALFRKGDVDDAIDQWRATLALHPSDPGTNTSLANALVQKGLFREAVTRYEIALQSEPESPAPLNNLAWLLSAGPDNSVRNGKRAVEIAQRLNRVTNQRNPFFIRTLAAAYAEAGQFENAVETGETASGLAHAQGQHELAAKIEEETNLYRQHQPFRDPTLPDAH